MTAEDAVLAGVASEEDAAKEITPPPHSPPPLEADAAEADHDYDDGDSGFQLSLHALSTKSIGTSIMKHSHENGRSYHSYKPGKYLLPNDTQEQDRLDLQHDICCLTLSGRLHLAPLPKAIHRVLDVGMEMRALSVKLRRRIEANNEKGCGTGIWSIEFADEHPETKVLGIDLSPIQPSFIPPNVTFEIDDLEEPWTFHEKFDFIYARMMTGSFADWPRFFNQSLEHLAPGGYIEMYDILVPGIINGGTWPVDSALRRWGDLLMQASVNMGRPLDCAHLYKQQMEEAGFKDVVVTKFKWPTNSWPTDAKLKEIGTWNLIMVEDHLTGLTQALLTRVLGWSMQELEVFLVDVRKEMRDTRIHLYFDILVVYGKKPS